MFVRFMSLLLAISASTAASGFPTATLVTFTFKEDWKTVGPVLLPCYKVLGATFTSGVLTVNARLWQRADKQRNIHVEDYGNDIAATPATATIVETGNVPICRLLKN